MRCAQKKQSRKAHEVQVALVETHREQERVVADLRRGHRKAIEAAQVAQEVVVTHELAGAEHVEHLLRSARVSP